ncbi:MAG: anaerobic sulfatase maturase [Promethearchaeota archaeon]
MMPFSLLIKPASADCNLRCDYCFYINHLNVVEQKPRMSDEVLEHLIGSYMRTDQNNHYIFGWQGGEPTLMGLDFFKNVVKLQIKYTRPGNVISNGLQTNGTLITEELARFFGEYKFLLGVSLDGPEDLHDYYRKSISQKPTHSIVMRGIKRLVENDVEFNILTLVNNLTVKKGREVYHYLRENGFFYHQYIPCVEFDDNNSLMPYSISGYDWGDFLCEIFDEWFKEDINKVSIRLFDSILEFLINGRYNICRMGNSCCQYFLIEYDGSVYPCDFFVRDNLLLGNILNKTWEDLLNAPLYRQFGRQKAKWHNSCFSCSFLLFCHGDCQKFRTGIQNNSALSMLCEGWKKFYSHSLPHFKMIAEKVIKRETKNISIRKEKKIGRNEPCPCGSGRKYKHCCLK